MAGRGRSKLSRGGGGGSLLGGIVGAYFGLAGLGGGNRPEFIGRLGGGRREAEILG